MEKGVRTRKMTRCQYSQNGGQNEKLLVRTKWQGVTTVKMAWCLDSQNDNFYHIHDASPQLKLQDPNCSRLGQKEG